MRNFLLHSIAFLVILGGLFVAHEVLAQTPAPPLGGTAPSAATSGWSWIGDGITSGFAILAKWIAIGVLSFFSFLVAVTGLLLNYAIYYLVIGMGDLVLNQGFGVPITELWTIIRDIVNLSFVFTLIYLGITTIIDGDSHNVKKILSSVVISALLVNFSLYFAKATIDVSNIVSRAIYAKMVSNPDAAVFDRTTGITGAFMKKLNVVSIMTQGGASESAVLQGLVGVRSDGGSGVAFIIAYSLSSGFLLFFLAFGFGMGAIYLILRFIMLIILMILSPIAFLPDVAGLGSYRKKWWETLISQAFMAPVYLFGLYMSYFIIAKAPVNTDGKGLLSLFDPNTSSNAVGLLLFYILAIALIIGTTGMAKSMSAKGASFASGATGWADKKLKGALKTSFSLPTKPAAYVARNGIKLPGKGRFTGARLLPGVGTASKWAGKWNDKLERTGGRRFAKGVVSTLSLGALDERARRKLVKAGKGLKIGSYSYQEEEDFMKERNQTRSVQERTHKRNVALAAYEHDKENEEKRKAAEEEVQKMTNTELEEETVAELKKISGLLSNKQMDGIKDSKDKFTEVAKEQIKEARKYDQMTRAGYKPKEGGGWETSLTSTEREDLMKRLLGDLKPTDIAKLPKEILNDMFAAKYITGEVLRKIHDGAEMKRKDAENLARTLLLNSNILSDAKKYLDNPRGQAFYGDHSSRAQRTSDSVDDGATSDLHRNALGF